MMSVAKGTFNRPQIGYNMLGLLIMNKCHHTMCHNFIQKMLRATIMFFKISYFVPGKYSKRAYNNKRIEEWSFV